MNQRPSTARLPRKRMTLASSALSKENPVGPALMLPAETSPGAWLAVPARCETAAVAPCTAVDGEPGNAPVVCGTGGAFAAPGCPATCPCETAAVAPCTAVDGAPGGAPAPAGVPALGAAAELPAGALPAAACCSSNNSSLCSSASIFLSCSSMRLSRVAVSGAGLVCASAVPSGNDRAANTANRVLTG